MPGLVDLVLPKRVVDLYGVEIPITGVDVDYLATLWDRFPQLADLAATGKVNPMAVLALGPEVTAAFIAAGTGSGGNPKAEAIARELVIGDKIELIAEIIEVSLPRGPGPFVAAFDRILRSLGMSSPTPAPAGEGESSGRSPTA